MLENTIESKIEKVGEYLKEKFIETKISNNNNNDKNLGSIKDFTHSLKESLQNTLSIGKDKVEIETEGHLSNNLWLRPAKMVNDQIRIASEEKDSLLVLNNNVGQLFQISVKDVLWNEIVPNSGENKQTLGKVIKKWCNDWDIEYGNDENISSITEVSLSTILTLKENEFQTDEYILQYDDPSLKKIQGLCSYSFHDNPLSPRQDLGCLIGPGEGYSRSRLFSDKNKKLSPAESARLFYLGFKQDFKDFNSFKTLIDSLDPKRENAARKTAAALIFILERWYQQLTQKDIEHYKKFYQHVLVTFDPEAVSVTETASFNLEQLTIKIEAWIKNQKKFNVDTDIMKHFFSGLSDSINNSQFKFVDCYKENLLVEVIEHCCKDFGSEKIHEHIFSKWLISNKEKETLQEKLKSMQYSSTMKFVPPLISDTQTNTGENDKGTNVNNMVSVILVYENREKYTRKKGRGINRVTSTTASTGYSTIKQVSVMNNRQLVAVKIGIFKTITLNLETLQQPYNFDKLSKEIVEENAVLAQQILKNKKLRVNESNLIDDFFGKFDEKLGLKNLSSDIKDLLLALALFISVLSKDKDSHGTITEDIKKRLAKEYIGARFGQELFQVDEISNINKLMTYLNIEVSNEALIDDFLKNVDPLFFVRRGGDDLQPTFAVSAAGLHVLFNDIVCNARELLKLVSLSKDNLASKHLAKYKNDINTTLTEGAGAIVLEVGSILKNIFPAGLLSVSSRLLAALFAIFEMNVETEKLKVKFESATGNMTTTIELPLLIEVGNDSKDLEQIKKAVGQLCNGINQIYPRVWGGDVAYFSEVNGNTIKLSLDICLFKHPQFQKALKETIQNEIIKKLGISDKQTIDKDTPLHLYLKSDDIKLTVVEQLINAGADVNALNEKKEPPLWLVMINKNSNQKEVEAILNLLLEKTKWFDLETIFKEPKAYLSFLFILGKFSEKKNYTVNGLKFCFNNENCKQRKGLKDIQQVILHNLIKFPDGHKIANATFQPNIWNLLRQEDLLPLLVENDKELGFPVFYMLFSNESGLKFFNSLLNVHGWLMQKIDFKILKTCLPNQDLITAKTLRECIPEKDFSKLKEIKKISVQLGEKTSVINPAFMYSLFVEHGKDFDKTLNDKRVTDEIICFFLEWNLKKSENQSRDLFFKDVNKEINNPTDYLLIICKHPKISLKSIQLLIDNKADLNKKNTEGDTALHLLCKHEPRPLELIALLVKAGADANVKNKNGKTVFDLIPEQDKKRLKELLVSKEPEKIVSNSFN